MFGYKRNRTTSHRYDFYIRLDILTVVLTGRRQLSPLISYWSKRFLPHTNATTPHDNGLRALTTESRDWSAERRRSTTRHRDVICNERSFLGISQTFSDDTGTAAGCIDIVTTYVIIVCGRALVRRVESVFARVPVDGFQSSRQNRLGLERRQNAIWRSIRTVTRRRVSLCSCALEDRTRIHNIKQNKTISAQ